MLVLSFTYVPRVFAVASSCAYFCLAPAENPAQISTTGPLYVPNTLACKARTVASCLSTFSVNWISALCTESFLSFICLNACVLVEFILSNMSLNCLNDCAKLPMSISGFCLSSSKLSVSGSAFSLPWICFGFFGGVILYCCVATYVTCSYIVLKSSGIIVIDFPDLYQLYKH